MFTTTFRILSTFILALLCSVVSGQSIWTNPITGTNPNTSNPYTTGQTVSANITVSGIGRGTGITGTSANDRYNANDWNSASLNANDYFTFTLTPAANYEIDFVSFVYNGQASGSGPTSFAVRSSVDGFASNIGTASSSGTISLSAAAYQNRTTAIEFRIYAWGASQSTGTFSVNDFTFNGAISAVPTSCTAPTTQASAVTFSSIGATSLNVNWTNGNGAGRVVIMNTTSSFTAPSNGSNPTANTTYGGSGEQVIFNGTGSGPVTVNGLTANTTYHFRVYEYCSPDRTYQTATATNNPNSQTTASASSPTINVGSLSAFGNQCIGTTSSELSYNVSGSNLTANIIITPPSGFEISTTSGSGFVANPSSLTLTQSGGSVSSTTIYVRFSPASATAFSGNISHTSGATTANVAVGGTGVNTAPSVSTTTASSIGTNVASSGGSAVSAGCGTVTAKGVVWGLSANPTVPSASSTNDGTGTASYTSTISGLTSGTTYNYRAYVTNSNGLTSYGTNTTFTTLKDEPTNNPTTFACGTSTTVSIPLTWVDATGGTTPDGYLIKWSSVSYAAITDPTDGSTANGSSSTTVNQGVQAASITGLSNGTTYYFKIYPYSNSGANINYKTSSPQQTSCTTLTAPWEDFETGVKTSYTAGNVTCTAGSWLFDDALLDGTSSDFYVGTQGARVRGNIAMNFNLTTGLGTVTLRHGMYGSDANATWRLEASTDNGSTWTAYQSASYTSTSSTFATQTITVNVAGNVRFRLIKMSGASTLRINFDDIYITPFNSAEINIKQGATNIPSGGSNDYGSLCESGASLSRSFTIENTGSATLNLSGTPTISLSNTTDFTLVPGSLATTVAASGNTSFSVVFDPVTSGAKTCTVSIANNDPDENPYTFTLQGTGTAVATPSVSIAATSTTICAGTSVTFTPTPSNIGGGTASYEWFRGGVSQGTGATFTTTTLANGETVSATMTVAGGSCLSSSTSTSNTIGMVVNAVPATPTGSINAAQNPACGSTTLSYSGASSTIYWQTSSSGTSTSSPTTSSYTVTASGTYYVRAYNGNCWSASSLASAAITVNPLATVSIAPTATQNISATANGSTLTASGTNISSVEWFYGTVSGGPYATSTGITSTTYTPNFSTIGTYYVVCVATNGCGSVTSNEVRINVSTLAPPVIVHSTPLANTSSTSGRVASATITSAVALTGGVPYLYYKINGGTAVQVSGVYSSGTLSSGAVYTFSIPGQSTGTLVEYYFTATNSAGTTRLPQNTNEELPTAVYYEYQIDCPSGASGTKTIAYQGFEFVGSSGYTFAVDNVSATPTGTQNYAAHPSAVEWKYYNQGSNGSLTATNRNSCACMTETYSGLPASCPDVSNPVYTAGGSSGVCRTFSGNSRGVYVNTPATTENPTSSRSRNGSYSYIQQSRSESGDGPRSQLRPFDGF